MLNAKKLDRLFSKFNVTPAEDLFLALLREAAALSVGVDVKEPQWSQQELDEALHGKHSLFSVRPVALPREQYLHAFNALKKVALAAESESDVWHGMPEAEAFFTQEILNALARNPEVLWDELETAGVDLDAAAQAFVPVACFAMRVFFDKIAAEACGRMNKLVPDTVHFERSLTCPICGLNASLAGVGATHNHGNVKRLYCSCCGGSWQFERIRCAMCGTEAVSDLQYVHSHDDDKHRLHVCSSCGEAVPTVFGAESDDFDPDFELWRSAELMQAYQQQLQEGEHSANA